MCISKIYMNTKNILTGKKDRNQVEQLDKEDTMRIVREYIENCKNRGEDPVLGVDDSLDDELNDRIEEDKTKSVRNAAPIHEQQLVDEEYD